MESQTSPQKIEPPQGLAAGKSPESTLWQQVPAPRLRADDRVRAEGKFLYAGSRKFDIQGVTYGPFRPDAGGHRGRQVFPIRTLPGDKDVRQKSVCLWARLSPCRECGTNGCRWPIRANCSRP